MANLRWGALLGGGGIPGLFGLNPLNPVGSFEDKIRPEHPNAANLIEMLRQIAGTVMGG